MHRKVIAAALAAAVVLAGSACSDETSSQDSETRRQQSAYDRLTREQPAEAARYSSTRATINNWIRTWGSKPGKLAYVYLQASNGQLVGYYVFKGLPVSYCASLTPTYRFEDVPRDGDSSPDFKVPAPAMDGVYYTGGGACNTYYGMDATTNSYMEYTVGTGINALVYERPLKRQDVQPLGFTRIDPKEK